MAKGKSDDDELPAKRQKTSLFPCGTCHRACYIDVVLCDVCDSWFHTACQSLSAEQIDVLRFLPKSFVCASCRGSPDGSYDFSAALMRLGTAAGIGWEEYQTTATVETVMMDSHQVSLPERPPEEIQFSATDLTMDQESFNLLSQNGALQDFVPVMIEGDGDALFRSISVALYGSDVLTQELRVLCCLEMVSNQQFYVDAHQQDELDIISPDYQQSCVDCATIQGASSAWTLHAMSSVIRAPIKSVYPTVNGLMDKCVGILNNKFLPRQTEDIQEPVSIMWTRFGDEEYPEGAWLPNHFVPLISGSPEELLAASTTIEVVPKQEESHQQVDMEEVTQDIEYQNMEEEEPTDDFPQQISVEEELNDDVPIVIGTQAIKIEAIEAIDVHRSPKKKVIRLEGLVKRKNAPSVPRPEEALDGQTLENGFLRPEQVLQILNTEDEGIQIIPKGLKENVYFVLDNRANLERRMRGQRSVFRDDCGSYDTKSSSTKTTIFQFHNEKMSYLLKKGKLYGRQIKKNFEPLDPQPEQHEIVIMKRYYVALRRKMDYKKRVTWFESLPPSHYLPKTLEKAIVEYIGTYPEEMAVHGNSKRHLRPYSQSPMASFDRDTENIISTLKPKQALALLVADGNDCTDLRQIQNKRYNLKKKAKRQMMMDILQQDTQQHHIQQPVEEVQVEEEQAQQSIVINAEGTDDESLLPILQQNQQLVLESLEGEAGEGTTYYIIHTDGDLEQVQHIEGVESVEAVEGVSVESVQTIEHIADQELEVEQLVIGNTEG